MKKSFFVGIGLCALGVIVLIAAFYALYMNSGTRLLYENSVWGARWRNYPWIFLAAGVILAAGGILMKAGYVPKAKRPKKARPAAVPKVAAVPAAGGNGGKEAPSAAPIVAAQGHEGFTLEAAANGSDSAVQEEAAAERAAGTPSAAPVYAGFDLGSAPEASAPMQEGSGPIPEAAGGEAAPSVQESASLGQEAKFPVSAPAYTGFDLESAPETMQAVPEPPAEIAGNVFGSSSAGNTENYSGFNLVNEPEAPVYRGFDLEGASQTPPSVQPYEGFTLQQTLEQAKEEPNTGHVCPICGAQCGAEAAFCGKCGAKLP